MKFEDTPLITPERVVIDPLSAFAIAPVWVRLWAPVEDLEAMQTDDILPAFVVIIGGKHRKPITLTALQFALLMEITRLGHTVVTNTNSRPPVPKIYAKLSFRDAPHDNMPVGRVFVDAGANEAVHALAIASDLRIPNLQKIGAGKPSKQAFALTMEHVERLAREREAGGTLPSSLSVPDYLKNVRDLWEAAQREAFEEETVA